MMKEDIFLSWARKVIYSNKSQSLYFGSNIQLDRYIFNGCTKGGYLPHVYVQRVSLKAGENTG